MNINKAASAYGAAANMKVDPLKGADDTDAAGGAGGFSDLVKGAVKNAIDTVHGAETSGMQAMAGKTGITDLVTAVNAAEVTLNTVVAVRDRVINAYHDILKMPI